MITKEFRVTKRKQTTDIGTYGRTERERERKKREKDSGVTRGGQGGQMSPGAKGGGAKTRVNIF